MGRVDRARLHRAESAGSLDGGWDEIEAWSGYEGQQGPALRVGRVGVNKFKPSQSWQFPRQHITKP